MDLTYMPGELDYKQEKKGNVSDMKREHDSVDDFEHLDPELSPVDIQSKGFPTLDIKPENLLETKSSKDHNFPDQFSEGSSKDELISVSKSTELAPAKIESGSKVLLPENKDLLTDFDIDQEQFKNNLDSNDQGKSNLLDFGMVGGSNSSTSFDGIIDSDHTKSLISAEISDNIEKTDFESDLLSKAKDIVKEIPDFPVIDNSSKTINNESDLDKSLDLKSMKEADALSQYDLKPEKKDIKKDEPVKVNEHDSAHSLKFDDHELSAKPEQETPKIIPELKELEIQPTTPEPELVKIECSIKEPEPDETILEPIDIKDKVNDDSKDKQSDEETFKPFIAICPSKPTAVTTEPVKKTPISDLDDIIGPEDVFKRIGLDAWFTPERLHPQVEALVYWRDPKKSGVVFGGIMAILLSLCYMSLISVVAYSSLLVLAGTICFRIYKNILQAVQKTSEGHPFKEFLELELSLPQDKAREIVDTAVVHVNAYIVELRRLFLVEDLIDSIKFGVCLWCLTYVGAIFNGMTLVILAFVALFTVPKIYENNKASIDQYIEMGRSKVADITSKVKAAVPIGKKEPEKDKEQ